MAFGQQSGPPASARQVNELLALLKEAGQTDFRDARGPMGFTQRQAAGKFTHDEAVAFIDQLQQSEADGHAPVAPPSGRQAVVQPTRSTRATQSTQSALRRVPADQLADELRRRGWTVVGP